MPMTKTEEKLYFYKMCFIYIATNFFIFLLLMAFCLAIIYLITQFISLQPYVELILVLLSIIFTLINRRRILHMKIIRNWLNYDLNMIFRS